jgi:glycosyltransferase involved in cell wall biosynthesis
MPAAEKKKIIIIGPAYPYRGGPSTFVSYIYNTAKDLFDIKIFNYKLLYPSFLFPGKTQYDQSKEKKFIVPSERIVNSMNPFNWVSVAGRLKKEKADLVIFDWWHPFFAPCHFTISQLAGAGYKGKILFITENYISHEQNLVDNILTKLGLHNADNFLALSATVEKELRANFPRRNIYRSELPSFDLFTANDIQPAESRKFFGLTENDKVLLFFGYVRKYKGLDILLEAMPAVLKNVPEVKLLIAGEFYDDVNNYYDIIKKHNLSDKVILCNEFISNEEVAKYFLASDLVVLPYRSATQSAVLNVAYSFNKPAVVTNVGGLSEFVKNMETGLITSPGSPEEISSAVVKYFSLEGKTDFAANIKSFREKNQFNNLNEIFTKIIEAKTV